MKLTVMVGVSGSGKSTYARENYPNHELISLDDIQNKDRTLWLNMVEQKLKEGKSVVADDENATKRMRKQLIDLGRKHGANITAVYLNMPLEKILERNKKRQIFYFTGKIPEESHLPH